MFNQHKDIDWLKKIEFRLRKIGQLSFAAVWVALVLLLLLQILIPEHQRLESLIAGMVGVLLFVFLSVLTALLGGNGKTLSRSGLIQFLYLETLDASFSLDGVVGAFAITKDIVIILIGLTIGAIFVRSITIFFTQRGTLEKYLFLEHGAHYAIGALALIMLLSIKFEIPEIVTGLVGVIFIGLSLFSSILHNRKAKNLK